MKEEELEFISVAHDDDAENNMENSYLDPLANDTSKDSVIGSWLFKQSKVKNKKEKKRVMYIIIFLLIF
jgi:hypothetical protein